ncbi:MAG: CPBP family intramembrane metalloprotease [Bacteroidetes bacterium]|nr:CPBP family intramembrane metalloprotease [Bacteroidota bacterium]
MSNRFKIHSPWSQLALFLFALGSVFVLFTLVYIFASGGPTSETARKLPDFSDPQVVARQKWIQAAWSVFIFGGTGLLYALGTFRRRPIEELGFRPAPKPIFYVLGVLILLVAFPAEGWLGTLNKHLQLPQSLVDSQKETDREVAAILKLNYPFDIFLNLFIVALLPAIFEEVCFRGALQRIMIHITKSPWAGIIISALLFSAFHMQFQGLFPRWLLGILLGAAYWYSGSLWTPILGHFIFNGIQVYAAGYYPSMLTDEPSVPFYWGLISLAAVAAIVYLMSRLSTTSYAQEYGDYREPDDLLSEPS